MSDLFKRVKSLFFSYFLCRFLKLNIIVKLNNQLWKKKIFFVQKNSAQIRSMVSSIKYISKIFRKTIISKPLIRISTCAFQGVRKVSFSKNFAYILNGLPSLHPWIKLEAHDKHFLKKTSWQFIFADKIFKTVCGNLRKIWSRDIELLVILRFRKIVLFYKIINKTTTANQENTEPFWWKLSHKASCEISARLNWALESGSSYIRSYSTLL